MAMEAFRAVAFPVEAHDALYLIQVQSWSGKSKKILAINNTGIVVYEQSPWAISNTWTWEASLIEAYADKKSPSDVIIGVRDNKKVSAVTITTDFRHDLLSDFQRSFSRFMESEAPKQEKKVVKKDFPAMKVKKGDARLKVVLRVRYYCIEELDAETNEIRTTYMYKRISRVGVLAESADALCIQFHKGPPKVYISPNRMEIIKLMQETCLHRIGFSIEGEPTLTLAKVKEARTLFHGLDEDLDSVSIVEFHVNKITPRHAIAASRLFCITEKRMVERDPATYSIVTSRFLETIFCIHRHLDDSQKFTIQFKNETQSTYVSTVRDAVITSLVDASRSVGNISCYVNPLPVSRGKRITPLRVIPNVEYQAIYLQIIASPELKSFHISDVGRIADTFNANIPYSSANFQDKMQKYIQMAIVNLLPHEMSIAEEVKPMVVVAILQALRRIFSTRIGFETITALQGLVPRLRETINACMRILNEHVNFAVTELLISLIQPSFENILPSDASFEQLNKRAFFTTDDVYLNLMKFIEFYSRVKTGSMVINGTIDVLVYLLCVPYADTTGQAIFEKILDKVASIGRFLFKLFHHPCLTVTKGVGMLMSALITESEAEAAKKIQFCSLLEGSLLRHLYVAMFTTTKTDVRQLRQRNLSRELVRLWTGSNADCMEVVKRILLPGLLSYLRMHEVAPVDPEEEALLQSKKKPTEEIPTKSLAMFNPFLNWHVRQTTNRRGDIPKAIVRQKRADNGITFGNWPLLFSNIGKDHARYDLIWNYYTREELRETLEGEVRAFIQDQEVAQNETLTWNYQEFEVHYPSLSKEPQAGDYFLRLLLESNKAETIRVPHPKDFFNDLYQQFFHEESLESRGLCLECLAMIYRNQFEEIGKFKETKFVAFLVNGCVNPFLRDRLLQFLLSLMLHQDNSRIFIESRGIPMVINFLTLAHLEAQRTVAPVHVNMITASENQVRPPEKEWYYHSQSQERCGPFSVPELGELWDKGTIKAKTLMWAFGMEDWAPLDSITQLRWTFIASGQPALTYAQLGSLCLDILIQCVKHYSNRDADGYLIRPISKVKRLLCESSVFPHIVQSILTFDPDIVDRASYLIAELVRENMATLPKIYSTGIFYFAMLYPGSNIIPLHRLLKLTHDQQRFIMGDTDQYSSIARSFLRTILPDAMVCFLSSYEPEKFTEIFLGEYDNPEVIWTPEMRRRMIEKISLHLNNFPLKLRANNKSLYQFVPIAPITYPELEEELFCSRYYLRHLCNTQRFPNWPLTHHAEFLQSVLLEWKKESEKKGFGMTREEARATLGLKPEHKHEDQIRRAYYKMAAKYHPDKNPDGRDMFEKIQKAHEILMSKTKLDGPDPRRVILLIQSQVILYSRYPEHVEPFRYAGYNMLLPIMISDIKDPTLFSNPTPMLPHATELCYHTMNVSPLNTEEVRREGGIDILAAALQRCTDLLTPNVTNESVPAQVCTHSLKAFSVLGRFPVSREVISRQRAITNNNIRCMHYHSAPSLIGASIMSASSFAADSTLQEQLVESGVLWYSLNICLSYDYTLEESGVEVTTETHLQHLRNQHAKDTVLLLARLGGYHSGDNETPKNELVRQSLDVLVTPFIVRNLTKPPPTAVLKHFNTNAENPYFIWNNEMRAELKEYLESRINLAYRKGRHEPENAPRFTYTCTKKELRVGALYIRIYNEQPKFMLEDPQERLKELLGYLEAKTTGIDLRSPPNSKEWQRLCRRISMVLESIVNLLTNHYGTEIEFSNAPSMKLISSFLDIPNNDEIPAKTMEIIGILASSTACMASLQESGSVVQILPILVRMEKLREVPLNILQKLTSNSKIVSEICIHGGILYLLDIYYRSPEFKQRSAAASVVAKLTMDKIYGQKITIFLAYFLPPSFLVVMKEDPNGSVYMCDNEHETPELIWTSKTRSKVKERMAAMSSEFYTRKEQDRTITWSIPENMSNIYDDGPNEVCIGGVYLKLYLRQPSWPVRNPRQFLIDMVERIFVDTSKGKVDDKLEMIALSCVALSRFQPNTGDAIASTGHLNKLFPLLEHGDPIVRKSTSLVLLSLTDSQPCIDILVSFEWINSVMVAMSKTPEAMTYLCEFNYKVFSKYKGEKGSLIPQAQKVDFPKFLMEIVDSTSSSAPNGSAIKALCINTLKSMTYDRTHGEAISRQLDAYLSWSSYRDQRQDLFLPTSTTQHLLAAPASGPTLLIGHGEAQNRTASRVTSKPPPLPPSANDDLWS